MNADEVEAIKRHFDVVSEETRSQIAGVAEVQALVAERVDGLNDRVGALESEMRSFKDEVRREFDETRTMIRLSYGELERRIVDLEDKG